MSPERLPIAKASSPGSPEGGGASGSSYPTRVRTLLGVPDSNIVPLASATNLPAMALPQVQSQPRAARDASDEWWDRQLYEAEQEILQGQEENPIGSESSHALPTQVPLDLPPTQALTQEQASSKVQHSESGHSPSELGTDLSPGDQEAEQSPSAKVVPSQITSINIPGATPLPVASAQSLLEQGDHSPEEEQHRVEQSPPTDSPSATSSAVPLTPLVADGSTAVVPIKVTQLADNPSIDRRGIEPIEQPTVNAKPLDQPGVTPLAESIVNIGSSTSISQGVPQNQTVEKIGSDTHRTSIECPEPLSEDREAEQSSPGRIAPSQISSIDIPGTMQTPISNALPVLKQSDPSPEETHQRVEQSPQTYSPSVTSATTPLTPLVTDGASTATHGKATQLFDNPSIDGKRVEPLEEPTVNAKLSDRQGGKPLEKPIVNAKPSPSISQEIPGNLIADCATSTTSPPEPTTLQHKPVPHTPTANTDNSRTPKDSVRAIPKAQVLSSPDLHSRLPGQHQMVKAPLGNQNALKRDNPPAKTGNNISVSEVTRPVLSPMRPPESVVFIPGVPHPVPTQPADQRSQFTKPPHPTDHSMVAKMTAKIDQLERTIADLSSQLSAQKKARSSASRTSPKKQQPKVVMQRPAAQYKATQAFWERSYISRFYR
jgi:hypothetical protein